MDSWSGLCRPAVEHLQSASCDHASRSRTLGERHVELNFNRHLHLFYRRILIRIEMDMSISSLNDSEKSKTREREELFASFLQYINDDYHELLDKEDQLRAKERTIQGRHEELGELEAQVARVELLQRENDRLRSEVHSKTARLGELGQRVSSLEDVEAENERLRREAESLRSELTSINQESDAKLRALQAQQEERAPSAVIRDYGSEDRPESVPFESYEKLSRYYRGLYEDKKTALGTYFVLASKLKRSKAKSREWERLFKRDEFEVMVNGETAKFRRVRGVEIPSTAPSEDERDTASSKAVQIPPSPRRRVNGDDAGPRVAASPGGIQIPPSTRASPANACTEEVVERETALPRVLEIPRSLRESSAAVPTSTTGLPGGSDDDPSSTQSQDPRWPDQEPAPQIPDYSSDTPTVVAERSVGKKCTDAKRALSSASRPLSKETGSFTHPVTMKSESSSESLNLPMIRQYNALATQDQEEPCTPDLDYNVQLRQPALRIYNEPQQPVADPQSKEPENRTRVPPPHRPAKRPALQPLDKNTVAFQRSDGKEYNQTPKRRKCEDRGAEAVHHLAEDGEEECHRREEAARKTPNTKISSNTSTPATSSSDRLMNLLAGQHGPKPILKPPRSHSRQGHQKRLAGYHQTTITKNMTTTPRTPQSVSPHKKDTGPTPATNESYDATPDDEPLRARPVHRLSLEDFKINPARNQGLDYAFQDVVRNKDERKCLSGCIRPDCCGPIFRTMAIEGRMGRPSVPETVTLKGLDEEDRRLLDEFLGDGKESLMTMPKEELRELLVDARTRQLADLFGKHRHAHERARSPPGFWRTDMPTTQENERYKEHAKELERIKVVERYREALKPGGRWIFADE